MGRRGLPCHGAGPRASRAIVVRDVPRPGLRTSEQSHSGRRATCVGASMNREHATLKSRAPKNYLILQGCFSYRGCSNVLSPTDGVRRSGTKRSALYQEWLVRFGFWIYGDLGGGGPARDVRHKMEKQRDLGVWLRINCLAALPLPPIAAVFHAFSFPLPPACLPAAASIAPPCAGCVGCRRQEPSHRRRDPCVLGR